MQQADIQRLKRLLKEYLNLVMAEGKAIVIANVEQTLQFVEQDLKENQP